MKREYHHDNYGKQPLSEDQIQALERIIQFSFNLTDLSRKFLIWLIRESEMLTKQVCIIFLDHPECTLKECREIIRGVSDVVHSRISLNQILTIMGSKMKISHYSNISNASHVEMAFDKYAQYIYYSEIKKEVMDFELERDKYKFE